MYCSECWGLVYFSECWDSCISASVGDSCIAASVGDSCIAASVGDSCTELIIAHLERRLYCSVRRYVVVLMVADFHYSASYVSC